MQKQTVSGLQNILTVWDFFLQVTKVNITWEVYIIYDAMQQIWNSAKQDKNL